MSMDPSTQFYSSCPNNCAQWNLRQPWNNPQPPNQTWEQGWRGNTYVNMPQKNPYSMQYPQSSSQMPQPQMFPQMEQQPYP